MKNREYVKLLEKKKEELLNEASSLKIENFKEPYWYEYYLTSLVKSLKRLKRDVDSAYEQGLDFERDDSILEMVGGANELIKNSYDALNPSWLKS